MPREDPKWPVYYSQMTEEDREWRKGAWASFFTMLCLFIFLSSVLDVSPLIGFF